jgi:hypothetical protein
MIPIRDEKIVLILQQKKKNIFKKNCNVFLNAKKQTVPD